MRHIERGPYEQIDPAFYATAAGAGLRHGELCGLRVMDVDFPAGKIRVRQNWVLEEYGTPKSRRSSRSVPMTDELAGALARLIGDLPDQSPKALVFADPITGGPMSKAKTLRRFRRVLTAAGVDLDHDVHSLRHTFGTQMAAGGVPIQDVAGVDGSQAHHDDRALRRLRALDARAQPGRGGHRASSRGRICPQSALNFP